MTQGVGDPECVFNVNLNRDFSWSDVRRGQGSSWQSSEGASLCCSVRCLSTPACYAAMASPCVRRTPHCTILLKQVMGEGTTSGIAIS